MMRSLFPKQHFKWKEPKEFRLRIVQAERELEKWWLRPVIILAISPLYVVVWGLARLTPTNTPPPLWGATMLYLALGVFYAYLVPKINQACPSWIMISDKRMWRSQGGSHNVWEFKDLDAFHWSPEAECNVLVLRARSGREFRLGVPLEVSQSEITSFLRSKIIAQTAGGPPQAVV